MNIFKNALFIILVGIASIGSAQGGDIIKETFIVSGNCDMCKSTIEASVKSIDGVKSAKWNVATLKMVVKFDSDLTDLDQIQKAIAKVGYDTEKYKATDEDYEKLHKCCKYDRS